MYVCVCVCATKNIPLPSYKWACPLDDQSLKTNVNVTVLQLKQTKLQEQRTWDVDNCAHISQMLLTSASVLRACSSCVASIIGSITSSAPPSWSRWSRSHCSTWLKLYLKQLTNTININHHTHTYTPIHITHLYTPIHTYTHTYTPTHTYNSFTTIFQVYLS